MRLSFSQNTLTGKVIDGTTHSKLVGASVFITEINKGTFTNENGEYTVSGFGKGLYKIKFSYLGYQTTIQEVQFNDSDLTLEVVLDKSNLEIDEVVVSGGYISSQYTSTQKIDVIKKEDIYKTGAFTVMDLISKVPGVDALTTGPLVSRPVIRGLSGNRILTVVDGVRFETQQWDEEHGIGINELGLGHIEIIKGPWALLYGPEAMGGVIHFVDEQPAIVGQTKGDITGKLHSNNLGGQLHFNIKGAQERYNWGLSALGKLVSDYFVNGYDLRIPNTRLLEYGAKGYFGISRNWGSTRVSYVYNQSFNGILDGKDIQKDGQGHIINVEKDEKEKFPFEIEAPFHSIKDHRISSHSVILAGLSKIDLVLGYQNNRRKENEELDGKKKGYNYLDMGLQSATYNLKWHLPIWKNFQTIMGTQGMLEKIKNYPDAATQVIPEATINDLGFFGLTKLNLNHVNFTTGIRYDSRHLITDDLDKTYDNVSSSFGVNYNINKKLLLRLSYASGYRSPNLNELTSNGVKLESQRYEIGDPNLNKEYNNGFDANIVFSDKVFTLELATFFNKVNNYIYLTPTGNMVSSNLEPSAMVPEYRFLQSDAKIKGVELILDIHPETVKWLRFETKLSALNAKRIDDDSYLPMMPTNKLHNAIFFNFNKINKLKDVCFTLGTLIAFKQSQVAENEMTTPAYTLLNASVGVTIKHSEVSLSATNILDKTYLDNMSRFRSYGISNPGLNISLTVKVPLNFNSHSI